VSRQTDLPFLSHFTKELGACNSFGGGKGDKFWEKKRATVTIRRFCLCLNYLRKAGWINDSSKMRDLLAPVRRQKRTGGVVERTGVQ
jgi:hypothetical protein